MIENNKLMALVASLLSVTKENFLLEITDKGNTLIRMYLWFDNGKPRITSLPNTAENPPTRIRIMVDKNVLDLIVVGKKNPIENVIIFGRPVTKEEAEQIFGTVRALFKACGEVL